MKNRINIVVSIITTIHYGITLVHESHAFSSFPHLIAKNQQRTPLISTQCFLGLNLPEEEDVRNDKHHVWKKQKNTNNRSLAFGWLTATLFIVLSTFGYSNDAMAIEEGPSTTATATSTSVSNGNSGSKLRYFSLMEEGSLEDRRMANGALFDWVVGTINTQYYDKTGGANFSPQDVYKRWKKELPSSTLDTRGNTVDGLKWLVSSLDDPYSVYLTRQELKEELNTQSSSSSSSANTNFFASRIGVLVEPTTSTSTSTSTSTPQPTTHKNNNSAKQSTMKMMMKNTNILSTDVIEQHSLPMVTAVIPDSIAERNGIVVGDYIVSIGNDSFLSSSSSSKTKNTIQSIANKYTNNNDNEQEIRMTMAKPIVLSIPSSYSRKDVILGYRLSHTHIHTNTNNNKLNNNDIIPTTVSVPAISPSSSSSSSSSSVVAGGNSIVHYQLLTPQDSLLFSPDSPQNKVGYIRFTRFSRSATEGYIHAIQSLEQAGAQSYIIDIRNNYGGIIQEAFITASTLLNDPHMVLSYTLNSRGGLSPQEVQKYTLDPKFPGHFLSTDNHNNHKLGLPKKEEWIPPSSYASIHEQGIKYGIHRPSYTSAATTSRRGSNEFVKGEKNVVVLINEGTASSAEVFASSLHDNGRLVALIGAKTYGKGLIQHTFPMPDGGGLRLTVGEYLTPSLQHVTKVGSAKYNDLGELIGGGIRPDVLCPSTHGIPSNVGADICVGMALDALQEQPYDPQTPNLL